MVVFERFFSKEDFAMASTDSDVTVKTGQFTKIGSKTVGAQQRISFGAGSIEAGVDSRQTAIIIVEDTYSVQISGKVRLAVSDANDVNVIPVVEDIIRNWSGGVKLAKQNITAKEDSKLVILLNPDSLDTVVDMSDASSRIDIPVTVETL